MLEHALIAPPGGHVEKSARGGARPFHFSGRSVGDFCIGQFGLTNGPLTPLATGCQSGLIGAILVPIEANRDGTPMSTKKPIAVRIAEGNPGKRRIDLSGVVEASGAPFIPEHLPDDARGCIEVIKSSMPPGVYSNFPIVGFRNGLVHPQTGRA